MKNRPECEQGVNEREPNMTAVTEHIAESETTTEEVSSAEVQEPSPAPHIQEAKRYRRRAQQAEASLCEVQTQLDEAQRALADREQTIQAMERRERIDHLLRQAETIDLEAARLLTEIAVQQMDEPDIEAAVHDLREARPYLFPSIDESIASGATSPQVPEKAAPQAERAAEEAVVTGRRDDLLRYLRLKRKGRGASD